jgi:hypothetical protein
MAGDSSAVIRQAVCVNINTPLSVLARLATDRNPEVRRLTALHANTPIETLTELATDSDPAVVLAVALHPRVDRSLLTELANNEDHPEVRVAARIDCSRCFDVKSGMTFSNGGKPSRARPDPSVY